jgi:glycosyltransferase involved in cell wall biosynthesis
MPNFKKEYKDYRNYVAVMISMDRLIFSEKSAVRARMIEQAKMYKELHIIIFSTIKFEDQNISPHCKIYSTNSFVRWNYVSNAYKIGKNILKNIPQDIPVLITCQDPFETGLVGKKLAHLRKNSELLLQIHTDLFSPYFTKYSFLNKIRLFISKYTLRDADMVRVVSNRIANDLLKKGFKEEEVIVKPIHTDIEKVKNSTPTFNLKSKYPQFKKIVIMVSRLEKEKNVEMAIMAWKKVCENLKDAGLVIIGSGRELNKLKKITYRLGIDKQVIFEGWQTDAVSYYKGADLLLVTSWYEGYGLVFKEAEAVGLKIVSTDVGIAGEVGAEIVPWNPTRIAEKIIEILK